MEDMLNDSESWDENGPEFYLLPVDEYTAEISEVEPFENDKGSAGYKVKFNIRHEKPDGSQPTIMETFTFKHDKQIVKDIARGKWKAMCMATGRQSVKSGSELLGQVLKLRIKHEKDKVDRAKTWPRIDLFLFNKDEPSQPQQGGGW